MITFFAALSLFAAAQDPTSVSVSYHDINLGTAAGQAELDRRIARAVETVCPTPDIRLLVRVQNARSCRVVAEASAAKQRQVALATRATPIQIGSSGR